MKYNFNTFCVETLSKLMEQQNFVTGTRSGGRNETK
jgi:hypothetical protein